MSKLQTGINILISKNKLDDINRRPPLIEKSHTKAVATCHKNSLKYITQINRSKTELSHAIIIRSKKFQFVSHH